MLGYIARLVVFTTNPPGKRPEKVKGHTIQPKGTGTAKVVKSVPTLADFC